MGQIGIFVRGRSELQRAQTAVREAGEEPDLLDADMQTKDDCVAVGTMHHAKGLEYRAVVIMACDEDVLPSLERLQTAGSDQDEI